MTTAKFDIDLKKGKLGEDLVGHVMWDAKIEVKRDMLIQKTKNIAVEYMCRGKPSGISVTEADWWCFIITEEFKEDNMMLFIKTERLKEICRKYYLKKGSIVNGGDDMQSRMILIPFNELLRGRNVSEE